MVALVLPAANYIELKQCCWRWRPLGYRIITLCDVITLRNEGDPKDLVEKGLLEGFLLVEEYKGWYASVNRLSKLAVALGYNWVVAAGTDMDPDPHLTASHIETIATQHFAGTFGIMQPTGDPWETGGPGRAAERICGSPWLGKKLIIKSNYKVFNETFFHYYGDELLKEASLRTGILWQNAGLSHQHRHPDREGRMKPGYLGRSWARDKQLFESTHLSYVAPWEE